MKHKVPLMGKRYVFEHKYLPQMIYQGREEFIIPFFEDRDHLNNLFDSFCTQVDGVGNPYNMDEFRVCVVRVEEDVLCLMLTFPEPEESPLCRNAFLFITEDFQNLCYYTIEKPRDDALPGKEDDDEIDFSFICAWVDGAHLNFGMHQVDSQEAMLTCYELFVGSRYAEGYQEEIERCRSLRAAGQS